MLTPTANRAELRLGLALFVEIGDEVLIEWLSLRYLSRLIHLLGWERHELMRASEGRSACSWASLIARAHPMAVN